MVVLSVTEGEDKPAKYPLMFHTSDTLVLNKIDLLPHLDFSMDDLMKNVRDVNPRMTIFQVSARTGEGMEALVSHIAERVEAKKKRA